LEPSEVRYQDFTLRAEKTTSEAILIQVLSSPAGEQRKPERIDTNSAIRLIKDLNEQTGKLERRKSGKKHIIQLGQNLANLLLPPRTRSMFEESLSSVTAQQEGLRLQLRLDAELSKYPWEYLHLQGGDREPDDTGFLALHPSISIVRYEEVEQRILPLHSDPLKPLSLFVGLSSPIDDDLLPLDLEQEKINIENALSGIDRIQFEFESATWDTLQRSTRSAVDIFHFVGHGGFDRILEQSGLYLTDATNRPQFATAEQVATLLRNWGTRLVVLNACETGWRDGENIWNSVVTALMRVGIPSAIAMQYKIFDKGAIEFSNAFYQAVVQGCSLDEAVLAGRRALFALCSQRQDERYWRDWGVIVLYSRVQSDVILLPERIQEDSDTITISLDTWIETCRDWLERQEQFRAMHSPRLHRSFTGENHVSIWLKPEKIATIAASASAEALYSTWKVPQLPPIAQVAWLEQIQSAKWLAVIGDPGSGKSTLLHQTAQWLLNQPDQVVLLVSLVDLEGEDLESYLLEKWLKLVLPTVAPEVSTVTPAIRKEFVKLVRTDRFWLLLDGLDELSLGATDRFVGILGQLHELMGIKPLAHVILTCRSSFWDTEKTVNWFDVYRILDLNHTPEHNQVQDFIRKWTWRSPQQGEDLAVHLSQKKYQPLQDLVKNPLRLALVCQLWQSDAMLPSTLVDLYRRFVQILCQQSSETEMYQPEQQNQLIQALGKLAIDAIDRSEVQFHLRRQWVEKCLGGAQQVETCLRFGWLYRVDKTVNALEEETFSFPHAIFQDYFASQAIGSNWHWLLQPYPSHSDVVRVFEPHWQTIILLWLEQSEDQFSPVSNLEKQAFIAALVDFTSQHDNIFQTCTLFTAFCLVAANLTTDPVADTLHRQLVKLYRTTPYPWLKEQAFSALQHLSRPELFEFLQEGLAISNSDHWFRSIQALGELGSDRAVEQLFEQYSDKGNDAGLILSILLKMPTPQAQQRTEQILDELLRDRSQRSSTLTHLLQLLPSTLTPWFMTKFQDLRLQPLVRQLLGCINQPDVKAFWQHQLQQILDSPHLDRTALLNTINAIKIPIDPVFLDRLQSFSPSPDPELDWAIIHFLGQQRHLSWQEVLHRFPPAAHPQQREQILTLLAQYQDPEAELKVLQFLQSGSTVYSPAALPQPLIAALGQFGSENSFQYLAKQLQFLVSAPMGDVKKEQAIVQSLYQISLRSSHLATSHLATSHLATEVPFLCSTLFKLLQRDPNLDEDWINVVVSLIFRFAQDHEIPNFLQLIHRPDLQMQLGDACLRFIEQESNLSDRNLAIVQQAIEAANISDGTFSDAGLAQAYLKLKMRTRTSAEIVSLLQSAISSNHPLVCQAAIELGLTVLSPDQITPLLVLLLESSDYRIVETAITAIGIVGNADHLDKLFPYLNNHDVFLREESYRAILKVAQRHHLLGHIRLRLTDNTAPAAR
jgi:HEAT repeat protein